MTGPSKQPSQMSAPVTGPTPAIPAAGRSRFTDTARASALPRTVSVPIWSLPIYGALTTLALLGTVLGVVGR